MIKYYAYAYLYPSLVNTIFFYKIETGLYTNRLVVITNSLTNCFIFKEN